MKNQYVKSDDGEYIYKLSVDRFETDGDHEGYAVCSLDLVCGKDYIHDDYDIIGWCAPDHFIEDVQYEQIVFYFESQSLEECLAEEGYSRVEELPEHIYQWGETPSEFDMMW